MPYFIIIKNCIYVRRKFDKWSSFESCAKSKSRKISKDNCLLCLPVTFCFVNFWIVLKIALSALHVSCNDDSECIEDGQCVQRNATLGKRCYCQEGFFEESPLFCNGKILIVPVIII